MNARDTVTMMNALFIYAYTTIVHSFLPLSRTSLIFRKLFFIEAEVRKSILRFFNHRNCTALVQPIEDKQLRRLGEIPFKPPDEEEKLFGLDFHRCSSVFHLCVKGFDGIYLQA